MAIRAFCQLDSAIIVENPNSGVFAIVVGGPSVRDNDVIVAFVNEATRTIVQIAAAAHDCEAGVSASAGSVDKLVGVQSVSILVDCNSSVTWDSVGIQRSDGRCRCHTDVPVTSRARRLWTNGIKRQVVDGKFVGTRVVEKRSVRPRPLPRRNIPSSGVGLAVPGGKSGSPPIPPSFGSATGSTTGSAGSATGAAGSSELPSQAASPPAAAKARIPRIFFTVLCSVCLKSVLIFGGQNSVNVRKS